MIRYPKFLLFSVCLFIFSLGFTNISSAQEDRGAAGTSERLDRLIRQVEQVEREQTELLKGQDEILEEIRTLKKWTANQ